jgi:hypothetical protein
VINSTIHSNFVDLGPHSGVGGGILNFGGTVTLTGSTVRNNYSLPDDNCLENNARGCGGGGGIYNTALGEVTITNSKVLSNHAVAGGGLLNYRGSAKFINSTFADNWATDSGGGIENNDTLNVVGSTISGNLASGYPKPYTVLDNNASAPGGECDPSDPTDPDCEIIYHASPPSFINGGGGLSNRGGAVLKNSTIAGNSTGNSYSPEGGGILTSGVLLLSNVTLWANKAAHGAGIYTAFAFVEIKNSILANEPGNGNCSINGGSFVSANHNLSDDATCAFSGAGDLNNVLAEFDPAGLTDNGGPTKTVALLPTSPAVDVIPAGDCADLDGESVAADQRGVLRPQGSGCDVGAYEYFSSQFPSAALRTYHLIGTVNSLSLEQTMEDSLNDQLQAAADSMNQGKVKAAINQLRSFINYTQALVQGGALTPAQGSTLIAEAEAIIQMIGG